MSFEHIIVHVIIQANYIQSHITQSSKDYEMVTIAKKMFLSTIFVQFESYLLKKSTKINTNTLIRHVQMT